MKRLIILFLLFLATLAVVSLYWYPIEYTTSIGKQYIFLSSHSHDTSEDLSGKIVIQEPFVPALPLAEVHDAKQKNYDEIHGSYIYNILE